ncbi:hypothetical protein N7540_003360 [Penicillium herquei]|nr:hypothetical protein N7540_003360 [Penicillium herquei]
MVLACDATEMNIEASSRIYSSLPQDCLRLVKIKGGSGDDEIECHLEETAFSNIDLHYEALSYLWGAVSQENLEYIFVEGESFRVTSNLAEALRMLRQCDKEATLWIDAFCVNQTDQLEKEEQIPRMGEIYRRASKVVAFLGKHDENSPKLFKFLRQCEVTGNYDLRSWLGTQPAFDIWSLPDIQSALMSLLHRKYWERAWVVQELVLASKKYIQCGRDRVLCLTLKKFHEAFVTEMMSIQLSPSDFSTHTDQVFYLNEWHLRFDRIFSTPSELPVIGFLNEFLESQCGEPRDHIYAFYNLLPADFRKQIPRNYQTPPENIIRRVFQGIIKETQSLNIITLRARQVSSSEKWQQSLPSWCPFLGVPYTNHPKLQDERAVTTEDGFANFSESGKVLHVKGVRIGEIHHILSRLPLAESPFVKLRSENRAKLIYEHKYAYRCLEFLVSRERVDLDRTVLSEFFQKEPQFLTCFLGKEDPIQGWPDY